MCCGLFVRFLASCQHSTFQLAFCFAEPNTELDRVVGVDSLALNCTPVVNLFEQNCDRVLLDERLHEVQVQPNRSKPHVFWPVASIPHFSWPSVLPSQIPS
ncbi:type VI secretion system baseplate subunit TssF [Mycobacterium tuberculosis]|uniref:type VI secretion system baseplate subunit TssF n=1 Tax=Mycobacterium tuberculosis TaxID=1773 RepID=UPI00350EC7AD